MGTTYLSRQRWIILPKAFDSNFSEERVTSDVDISETSTGYSDWREHKRSLSW